MPGGIAHHRQTAPIRERQGGVVQAATPGEGKAQVAPDLSRAPRRRGKGHHAQAPLGSACLGHGTAQVEGTEQPASSGAAERGTAGPGGTQGTSQGIEAIGVHPVRSPLRSAPLRRTASCRDRDRVPMRKTTDLLAPRVASTPGSRRIQAGGSPTGVSEPPDGAWFSLLKTPRVPLPSPLGATNGFISRQNLA